VLIGFGSMTAESPQQATRLVIQAVQEAGVRAVVASGWAGLGEAKLPDSIHLVGDVPHSWLFPRTSAVVHHGGAGTTAAGLRAGVPSIIVPFHGDQPFWGRLVHERGLALTHCRATGSLPMLWLWRSGPQHNPRCATWRREWALRSAPRTAWAMPCLPSSASGG